MKRLTRIMAVLALALAAVVPAQAQFRIGPRVGVAVNKFSFNKELLNSDNRAGFTGGLMVEFTVPIVGIGLDASVMYARRSLHTVTALDNEGIADGNTTISKHLDYIDIPVNLKYKLGLPVLSKIVKPYFTTRLRLPRFRQEHLQELQPQRPQLRHQLELRLRTRVAQPPAGRRQLRLRHQQSHQVHRHSLQCAAHRGQIALLDHHSRIPLLILPTPYNSNGDRITAAVVIYSLVGVTPRRRGGRSSRGRQSRR